MPEMRQIRHKCEITYKPSQEVPRNTRVSVKTSGHAKNYRGLIGTVSGAALQLKNPFSTRCEKELWQAGFFLS